MNSQEEHEVRAMARAIAKEEIALALKALQPVKQPAKEPAREPEKAKSIPVKTKKGK